MLQEVGRLQDERLYFLYLRQDMWLITGHFTWHHNRSSKFSWRLENKDPIRNQLKLVYQHAQRLLRDNP